MRQNKIFILITNTFLFCLIFTSVQATTYYIDKNNAQASDDNPGTLTQPWLTIHKANKTLIPGDTVFIKSGIYNFYVSPVQSGTATNRITYRNYKQDSVTITDTTYGIRLNAKSYITIQGINFYNLDKFLWLQQGANHNVIAYCNFDQGRNIGWSGSKIYQGSSYNRVHHCRFSKYGKYTDDDIGCLLDIGNENSKTDTANHNLFESNHVYHGGHHLLGVYGMYNVIRNNYFHNENWLNDHGNRNVSLSGYAENSGWNLIEGNRIAYSGMPPDNWGASGMGITTSYNIVRFNKCYYNNLSGMSMTLTSSYCQNIEYNKIYNNTFLYNGFNMSTGPDALTSAIGFAIYSGDFITKGNVIKNNLYYGHYQSHGTYKVNLSEQEFINNWSGDTLGDPGFINARLTLESPMDTTLPDLRLQSHSPCIDSGTWLTTITSPSGSGISFQVDDARYFMDGWGIIKGDKIQLEGSVLRAFITGIDYDNKIITVENTISWTQGTGVSLMYEGLAPDIGAHEYNSNVSMTNNVNIKNTRLYLKIAGLKININSKVKIPKLIEVINLKGRKIVSVPVKSNSVTINYEMNTGCYIVRIIGNSAVVNKKVFLVK